MASEHKIKIKLKVGAGSSASIPSSAKDEPTSPVLLKIKTPASTPGPAETGEGSEVPKLRLGNSGSASASASGSGWHSTQAVAGPSKIRLSLSKTSSTPSTSAPPVVSLSPHSPNAIVSASQSSAPLATSPTPAVAQPSPQPSTASSAFRPMPIARMPKTKVTKPKATPKLKPPPKPKPPPKLNPTAPPPSAIPQRLLSQPPTPKPSSSSLPSTPKSDSRQSTPDVDAFVKQEPETPGADDSEEPDPLSLPYEEENDEEITEAMRQTRGSVSKAPRAKKPLRDCLNKIMVELRKKDEYDIFSSPVDLTLFPDYLQVIGGEENMMDLSTMQNKVDDGEYRSLDMLEADLKLLVDAAHAFNGPGPLSNSATKLQQHGLKQTAKWRPVAASPSPSRKSTPLREGTAMTDEPNLPAEIPPYSYIPDEMLTFPPNTLEALAVGWNLTGGRRVHAKRIIRQRDRFIGKWRHFDLDGTRDLAEMEEPTTVLDAWREFGPNQGINWLEMRTKPKWADWWSFDLGGTSGQAPVPLAPYPLREPLPVERIRPDHNGGPLLEIDVELSALKAKKDGPKTLEEHIRPIKFNAQSNPAHFVNLYEKDRVDPSVYLSDLTTGGTMGEAYLRSVRSFLPDLKEGEEEHEWLHDNVERRWRGGVVESDEERVVRRTLASLPSHPLAKDVYQRKMLSDLLVPEKAHDIAPFLTTIEEFTGQGIAKPPNFQPAFDFISNALAEVWTMDEKERQEQNMRLGKRERVDDPGDVGDPGGKRAKIESAASSPLSAPPDVSDTAKPASDQEQTRPERLLRLKRELHSLSRFYPLYALKEVSKEFAERVLPPNVRGLMTTPRQLVVLPSLNPPAQPPVNPEAASTVAK